MIDRSEFMLNAKGHEGRKAKRTLGVLRDFAFHPPGSPGCSPMGNAQVLIAFLAPDAVVGRSSSRQVFGLLCTLYCVLSPGAFQFLS